MAAVTKLKWLDVQARIERYVLPALERVAMVVGQLDIPHSVYLQVYGVPRGGVPVAALTLAGFDGKAKDIVTPHHRPVELGLANTPGEADLFVDDIIDSGATRDRYAAEYPDIEFVALVDKTSTDGWARPDDRHLGWVKFPWDEADGNNGSDIIAAPPEDNVRRLLQYIGEDASREGLLDTPKRVTKALREMTCGYGDDPAAHLARTFEAEHADELVIVRDIPFWSLCEHHMLPFHGLCSVAYIPAPVKDEAGRDTTRRRVVGLSKIPRVVNLYARRLQIQERMTAQIAEAMQTHLGCLGVAVTALAHHTCMAARGVGVDAPTRTCALHGVFRDNQAARDEVLRLMA